MSDTSMFSSIDNAIIQLDNFKSFLDAKFAGLEKMTQAQIDDYIENTLNPELNSQLASIRANIVSTLKSMYSGYLKLVEKIQPIADAEPTDLGDVISFCNDIKAFITSMYSEVLLFVTQLTSKLADLTVSITSLVAYRPSIQGINFDKLNLSMETITIQDITGD